MSLHDQVASLDIPEPTKFLEKSSNVLKTAEFGDRRYRGSYCNNANPMNLYGLLGSCLSQAGRDQQTGYELAPLHSITSSVRTSNVGGMVMPSALAVLRFITSSNFVGCWIGRSAGFAPFRMASTYVAARRFRSVMSGA